MSAELIEGKVRVCLDWIGEGWNGDYNEDDPEDEPLLRFDVYVRLPDEVNTFGYPNGWYPLDDASYCTAFPQSARQIMQERAVDYIMDSVEDLIKYHYDEIIENIKKGNYEDGGIKKICERLSWIDPTWVDTD